MESEWLKDMESAEVARRRQAAARLLQRGSAAAPAAVALVKAILDEDEEVRELVMGALEDLGPPPPSSLPELRVLSRHANGDVAYWAVTLLGRLGPQGTEAEPDLVACLQPDCPPAVRQRAAWALGRLGVLGENARSMLRVAAQDSDPRLARLARESLG